MTAPDPLRAITDLRDCMQRRDFAGAARLVQRHATLDGLNALAGPAWQSEAERAYRLSVLAWRAEHEETLRRRQAAAVGGLVAALAGALSECGWPMTREDSAA